jgi:hypothetical protein
MDSQPFRSERARRRSLQTAHGSLNGIDSREPMLSNGAARRPGTHPYELMDQNRNTIDMPTGNQQEVDPTAQGAAGKLCR